MALDLTQIILEVRKKLKPTQFYMLNNLFSNLQPTKFYMLNIFGFNNFLQKSRPGVVLALSLLLAVYGPGLGPDGSEGPEKP